LLVAVVSVVIDIADVVYSYGVPVDGFVVCAVIVVAEVVIVVSSAVIDITGCTVDTDWMTYGRVSVTRVVVCGVVAVVVVVLVVIVKPTSCRVDKTDWGTYEGFEVV
jgi:hypothetical protein